MGGAIAAQGDLVLLRIILGLTATFFVMNLEVLEAPGTTDICIHPFVGLLGLQWPDSRHRASDRDGSHHAED